MVVPGDGFVTTTTFCDGSGELALTTWRLEILLRVEECTSVANLGAIVSMQWTTCFDGSSRRRRERSKRSHHRRSPDSSRRRNRHREDKSSRRQHHNKERKEREDRTPVK
ncbi:hypothetical protein quinque_015856, partial [Culex quinquefasciatus]